MQFKHKQIIDTPVDYAFTRASDFARFEKQSSDKGFGFKRHGHAKIEIGTQWNITLPFRGRRRKFMAELCEFIPPRVISYKSTSMKYQAALSLTFTPISAQKCRMDMLMVAQARSLGARMLFGSIRLARRRINKRLRREMQEMADRLANDYQKDSD